MDSYHQYGFILMCVMAFASLLLRFLPLLIFKNNVPNVIKYLGKVLPSSVMGMLIIYCMKDITIDLKGLVLVLAVIVTIIVHKWKHNMLLSVFAATAFYSIFISFVLK